jgi:hypothetical protein
LAPVGYDAYVQADFSGVGDDLEKILSQEWLPACDSEEACSEIADLVDHFQGGCCVQLVGGCWFAR